MVVFDVKFRFTFDIFSHLTLFHFIFVAAKNGPKIIFTLRLEQFSNFYPSLRPHYCLVFRKS